MTDIRISDAQLRQAAEEGMDAFVHVFVEAIRQSIHGELTAETMAQLNADQITLLAWDILHEEVAKAVKLWGMRELSKLIYDAHTLYLKYKDQIEVDCTEEEFMALFEKCPEFDEMDDTFVENEEAWTAQIAEYIDQHLEQFAHVE